MFGSVQSLSRVRLFATPWIAARQASLSITNSQSSFRFTSIESVMPSSHLIPGCPLLLLPPIPPSIRVFSNDSFPNLFLCMYSLRPHQALGEAEDLGDLMVLEGEGIQPSTLREGFSIHRAESWSLLKERWVKYEVVLEEREMAEHLMAADDQWEPAGEVEALWPSLRPFWASVCSSVKPGEQWRLFREVLGWFSEVTRVGCWHSAWWTGRPRSVSLAVLL